MTTQVPAPPPGARTITYDRTPHLSQQVFRAVVRRGRRPEHPPALVVRLPQAPVEPERLARYQRVCGFRVRDVVPITFLHTLAFPGQMALMLDHPFPLPPPGMVHLENRMTQLQPVQAGDRLTPQVWAGPLREHPKGVLVDLIATLERDGQPVWAGVSTYLSVRKDAAGQQERREPLVPQGDVSARWQVRADTGRRYAAVSGDHNPIHLHPVSARALGMKHPIAHGMWSHARSIAGLGPLVPERVTTQVSFHRPVPLPSTVEARVSRSAKGWQVDLSEPASNRLLVRSVITPA